MIRRFARWWYSYIWLWVVAELYAVGLVGLVGQWWRRRRQRSRDQGAG